MTMGQLAKAVVVHCVGYPLFAVNECCVVDLLVSTVFDADQCRRSMEDQWRQDRLTILWQPEVWCRCTLGLIKYAMHNASSLWVCTRWLSSMKAKFWRSHYSLNTGMEDAVQWNIHCSSWMELLEARLIIHYEIAWRYCMRTDKGTVIVIFNTATTMMSVSQTNFVATPIIDSLTNHPQASSCGNLVVSGLLTGNWKIYTKSFVYLRIWYLVSMWFFNLLPQFWLIKNISTNA